LIAKTPSCIGRYWIGKNGATCSIYLHLALLFKDCFESKFLPKVIFFWLLLYISCRSNWSILFSTEMTNDLDARNMRRMNEWKLDEWIKRWWRRFKTVVVVLRPEEEGRSQPFFLVTPFKLYHCYSKAHKQSMWRVVMQSPGPKACFRPLLLLFLKFFSSATYVVRRRFHLYIE